jgi:hypothetical protein
MSTHDIDSGEKVLSAGVIVAIVIGAIFLATFCVGTMVVVVCLIRHWNRSRYPATQAVVLRPAYVSPHACTWNTPMVANYSAFYQSVPPPYTASTAAYVKPVSA